MIFYRLSHSKILFRKIVLNQCTPFMGFTKTLNAIAAMNEVFLQQGIDLCRFQNSLRLNPPRSGTRNALISSPRYMEMR